MPKIKMKIGTREIEDDQGTPIFISNQKPFNDEEEDYDPSASHSKGKKKRKKNRADQSKEDKSPKEQGEVKSDKKKQKEKDKVEDNDACYLPGQKHDRPHERDPLRIFFEVLYQQLPDCELAATWMMEWGLLRPEEAMKVYERQLKKNQQQELGSPADAVSLKTTSKILSRKEERVSSNAGAKSKKRKASNSISKYDLIVSKIKKKKKKKKKKQKVSSS